MNTNNLTPAAKEALISATNKMKTEFRNLIGDMMISGIEGWEMDLVREAAEEFETYYTGLMMGNFVKAGGCYSCVNAALNVTDQDTMGANFENIKGAWMRLARAHQAFFKVEQTHNLRTFA